MNKKKDNIVYSDKQIKEALILKFENNLSLSDISGITNIPQEYIRKLVQGKLRKDLVMDYLLHIDNKKLDF